MAIRLVVVSIVLCCFCVGLLALLFVKYEWLPHVNLVEADNTKLMFESLVGSKGAIGVRAKVGNETICLINSHLPAHLADHRERDKVGKLDRQN